MELYNIDLFASISPVAIQTPHKNKIVYVCIFSYVLVMVKFLRLKWKFILAKCRFCVVSTLRFERLSPQVQTNIYTILVYILYSACE